jgi:hypothetical protein
MFYVCTDASLQTTTDWRSLACSPVWWWFSWVSCSKLVCCSGLHIVGGFLTLCIVSAKEAGTKRNNLTTMVVFVAVLVSFMFFSVVFKQFYRAVRYFLEKRRVGERVVPYIRKAEEDHSTPLGRFRWGVRKVIDEIKRQQSKAAMHRAVQAAAFGSFAVHIESEDESWLAMRVSKVFKERYPARGMSRRATVPMAWGVGDVMRSVKSMVAPPRILSRSTKVLGVEAADRSARMAVRQHFSTGLRRGTP